MVDSNSDHGEDGREIKTTSLNEVNQNNSD